jgi:uncharacterized membrane protein
MNTARNIGVAIAAAFAITTSSQSSPTRYCSQTAQTLFSACTSQVTADSLVKKAACGNISDDSQREGCLDELRDTRDEGKDECKDQRDWRLEACDILGEDRYDPDLTAVALRRPKTPGAPNPYFPLQVGNRWEYLGGGERNTVEIVNETKLIEGVTCLVGRDLVFEDDELHEATDDWYRQAKDGRLVLRARRARTTNLRGRRPDAAGADQHGGSFKAGRARPSPASSSWRVPTWGMFTGGISPGQRRDVTVILTSTYSYGQNAELDQLVPQALVERFCKANCCGTRNFSLLEPGGLERKYYARGIGVILESSGRRIRSQLVDCSFDARCHNLRSREPMGEAPAGDSTLFPGQGRVPPDGLPPPITTERRVRPWTLPAPRSSSAQSAVHNERRRKRAVGEELAAGPGERGQ